MTAQLTISTPEEGQALADYAKAAQEAERAAASAKQHAPVTHVPMTASVEFRDGQMTLKSSRGNSQVTIQGQAVPKGFVKLSNGATTTIEAAEAAGLMDLAVEFNKADQGFKTGPQKATSPAEAPNTPGQDEKTEHAALDGVPQTEKAQITKAEGAIAQANAKATRGWVGYCGPSRRSKGNGPSARAD